jgi:hypothetical protein
LSEVQKRSYSSPVGCFRGSFAKRDFGASDDRRSRMRAS